MCLRKENGCFFEHLRIELGEDGGGVVEVAGQDVDAWVGGDDCLGV